MARSVDSRDFVRGRRHTALAAVAGDVSETAARRLPASTPCCRRPPPGSPALRAPPHPSSCATNRIASPSPNRLRELARMPPAFCWSRSAATPLRRSRWRPCTAAEAGPDATLLVAAGRSCDSRCRAVSAGGGSGRGPRREWQARDLRDRRRTRRRPAMAIFAAARGRAPPTRWRSSSRSRASTSRAVRRLGGLLLEQRHVRVQARPLSG